MKKPYRNIAQSEIHEMKKVTFIICLIYWLLPFTGNTQQITSEASINYRIKGDFPTLPLPQPKWIIEEGNQPLSIEDVRIGNLKDGQFTKPKINQKISSLREVSFWFRLKLSTSITVKDWKMVIDRQDPDLSYDVDQAIDKLTAYFYSNDQLIDTRLTGRAVPTSKRDLTDFYYQSILFLDLVENDTLDIWVHIKAPSGSQTATITIHNRDFELSPVPWPFKITTYNFYMGFLTTLLIIGVFLMVWFKEKVYVWFLFYLLLNTLTLLVWKNQTTIVHWFTPENPEFSQRIGFVLDMIKWGVLLLFGRIFIDTKKNFPRLDNIFISFAILFILISVFIILFKVEPTKKSHQIVFFIIFVGVLLPILSILTYFIFSKNNLARFYGIGAIIPFLGIFIIGLFREILWVRTISEVLMSMGPMITLTLAVVYRFRLEARGRIAAEQERSRLLENQTDLLEQQVEERTSELNQTLENLKSTQSQLIQQEKLASLGQLTAGIAHEIKNPLNFVNNFSEVSIELIEEAQDELKSVETSHDLSLQTISELLDDVQTNLHKIHEHGSRANNIVSSMLQHSRGGSGKKEPTDLNALIKEYVNLCFHGMLAGKNPINVDIQLDLDDSIGDVPLISEDFSRVILNVCNNAFDAMRTVESQNFAILPGVKSKSESRNYTPKLTIRTKKSGDAITIELEDNGSGIPQDIKDKVLQPFFTTKKGTEGTGLGLSISHDIVKAHGGEIIVESEEGKGTEFTIKIPMS